MRNNQNNYENNRQRKKACSKKWILGAALLTAGLFVQNGNFINARAAEVSGQVYEQNESIALTAENFSDDWILQGLKEFDADGDGTLSTEEIDAVTELTFESGAGLHGVAQLDCFKNLKKLQLGTLEQPFTCAEPLDFTGFSNLEQLFLYRGAENSDINVSGLSKLKKIVVENVDAGGQNEERIDLTDTPALKNLRISNAGSAVFDEKTAIKNLYLYGSAYASIHSLEAFPNIEWLVTSGIDESLTTLDFTVCPKLRKLKLFAPEVETIILPKSLQVFSFSDSAPEGKQLKTLDISAAVNLKSLIITECDKLEMPDLSSYKKLKRLSLECQLPTSADFSENQKLASVYLRQYGEAAASQTGGVYSFAGCEKLVGLKLKNVSAKTLTLPENGILVNLTLKNMKYLTKVDAAAQKKLGSLKLTTLPALKKIRLPKESSWKAYKDTKTGIAYEKKSGVFVSREL